MKATLDQMIQFIARQTKRTEDVVKSGGVYADEALDIVNKYIDGINYAKNKILRERYKPTTKETKTIGSDNMIDMDALTKTPIKINRIYLAGTSTEILDWDQGVEFTIEFPTESSGTQVDIEYAYMVEDFPNNPTAEQLLTELDFPEAVVDYRILCFYACYEYHLIKGSDKDFEKTGFFLSKWNDGFTHIKSNLKGSLKVRDKAGY